MNDATDTVVQWICGPNYPNHKALPKWMRSFALDENGVVYVPAGFLGSERTARLMAWEDDLSCVLNGRHIYLPAQWMARQYPELREMYEQVERQVRAHGDPTNHPAPKKAPDDTRELQTVMDEVRQLIRERVGTREWWIFVAPDRSGIAMLDDVERRFYSRKGNDGDYELLMCRTRELGLFPVILARKTQLPKAQLAPLIPVLLERIGGCDEVMCPRLEPLEQLLWIKLINRWIHGVDQ